jgi:hypothetical protein
MTAFRICQLGVLLVVAALVSALARSVDPGAAASQLFGRHDVLPVRLEAPFNALFAHVYDEDEYSVMGTLSRDAMFGITESTAVRISVRGNSSKYLNECTFPKLKLRLAADGRNAPPPFAGLKSVKIGTHCGERPDGDLSPELGRWANDKAPHREALVYRLLDVMGLRTLTARPARIEYVYTDPQDGRTPDQHRPIARNALFLEDDDDASERLAGDGTVKGFIDGRSHFTSADVLNLAFGEAMIGNFDWCLKFAPEDPHRCDDDEVLYNVLAFRGREQAAFPVMYDFDLAGMVTGRHRWFDSRFDKGFVASRSAVEIEAISQVQRMRGLFSRAELDEARVRFISRKSAVYQTLKMANVDAQGRDIIRSYLDAFFAAIEDDAVFYRSVMIRAGEFAYADPEGAAAICSELGPIPIGTPVSEPRASSGTMIQIHLLDVMGELAKECPALRHGPVWVHREAVSADFPDQADGASGKGDRSTNGR